MRRILVIYHKEGFLDLVKRVLADTQDVEVFRDYRSASNYLSAAGPCQAVLCGLADVERTIELFTQATALSSATRLILVATNEAEVTSFRQHWLSDPARREQNPAAGQEWVREHVTVAEIRKLLPPAAPPKKEAGPAPAQPVTETGAAVQSPAAETVIDGYRLLAPIGQGGFGTLWLAANDTTGQRFALKCVEGEEQVPQELAGLSKYVYVADRCEHLIPIEHIHHDGDRLWLVTPLADSLTGADTPNAYKAFSLANHLQARGRLSDGEAVSIGLCLVRGLLALHHSGLLHGDVAPANILRIHRRWVLADPGLVRFLGEPGICRNRRYYPLPQPVRQNDDFNAVGVILWEMTSGLAEMQSGQERLNLDTRMLQFLLRSDLPLARLICHAAATAPEQRYMNGEEMLQDLEFVTARLPAEGSTYSLYNYPNLRALRTNGALPPLA
jgi:hypothetical protein